ncbi:haloacid dehalogenase [Aspergillus homomorphus CBS 101889]|uniref:Haloacid dehalogenase n=1 Tax=Aspergillus homomorphus (strain CBS 101889) TaxID=1450537 RepID=A0A395I425_ASPHC|nr:haloacid dehalogenase [Aspergillus homomorphus CBS 101889]RAL14486.1 haloacid dehalogenase [Aspergillus homomorphus CBS 101889]
MSSPKIKAVFFDFMGTCLDWHSSIVQSMPPAIPEEEASQLALDWRRQYFLETEQRVRDNLPPEDIDQTLARALPVVLRRAPKHKAHLDPQTTTRLLEAWHSQPAWPEVPAAVQKLRNDLGLEVFVLANGTTRLQLDLTRSSGLSFNMLFSSQLLGVYKPSPEAYRRGLELVKLRPEEVVLVAAHAYDLRGAQRVGMRTIYIHRWTDDMDEDMETVRGEFDVFLEGMEELPEVIARLQLTPGSAVR